ncbi:uncharacterized protein LOC143737854 [Siphateles boraxobius]|uniref:uncharacterized protein LOC143737854 n=1 Tax=Siphateles boraxobius TaxID=180520 RepID=UPI0040644CAA
MISEWVSFIMFYLLAAVLSAFLAYCLYVRHVHQKYDHILRPPRDNFLLGHLPSFRRAIKSKSLMHDLFLQCRRSGRRLMEDWLKKDRTGEEYWIEVADGWTCAEFQTLSLTWNQWWSAGTSEGSPDQGNRGGWKPSMNWKGGEFNSQQFSVADVIVLLRRGQLFGEGTWMESEWCPLPLRENRSYPCVGGVHLDEKRNPLQSPSSSEKGAGRAMGHTEADEKELVMDGSRRSGRRLMEDWLKKDRTGEEYLIEVADGQVVMTGEINYGPVYRMNSFHNVTIMVHCPEATKKILMSPKYLKDPFVYKHLFNFFGKSISILIIPMNSNNGIINFTSLIVYEYIDYFEPFSHFSIQFSSYVSQRLEKFFKDPLKFDPERFDVNAPKPYYCYYPFALGPRTCLWQVFSQLKAKVVLAKLLQRFEFSLVPGQSYSIKETGNLWLMSGVISNIKPC